MTKFNISLGIEIAYSSENVHGFKGLLFLFSSRTVRKYFFDKFLNILNMKLLVQEVYFSIHARFHEAFFTNNSLR